MDGETDESWIWFFTKLSSIIEDSGELTIVTDRHSSIYKGVSTVYPKACHGACIVHLERNVSSNNVKYGVSGLFLSAAKAYRVGDFKKYFNLLKKRSPIFAIYLEDIGFEHWTRAYCEGERFNMMTSNIGESLNAVIAIAKGYPIV